MTERERLRVLLVLKHAGYIGVYEPLVRELAERGHTVVVGCMAGDSETVGTDERLPAETPVSVGHAPRRGIFDGWASVAWLARALGDLGRYCDPRFAAAVVLRRRMSAKVESHLASAAGFDPLTRRLALRQARRLAERVDAAAAERAIARARRLESAIPISRPVSAYIRKLRPDVVLVSPVIELASPLVDYLRAARRLGVPTGICVASWDNLTSKGLLRFIPERVFVWNETQRREAAELHGVPADRVVATGAARFDEWFDGRPTRTRDDFMRAIGLDASNPYLLYLCSSGFVAPDEVESVSHWIEALRTSPDERVREAGVIVRPHPKRVEPWRNADLSRFGNVTVWPRDFRSRAGAEGRADFYDSIAHSAAVVGVNTSAMLEAAIVGKSVYTLVSREFAQEETIHFHYLLDENGGFLHVAESEEAHLAQLAEGLDHQAEEAEQARAFIESFLRPGGPARSATAIYADAVEELARLPAGEPETNLGLRLLLAPVALAGAAALAVRVAKAAVGSRLPRQPGAEPGKARARAARA